MTIDSTQLVESMVSHLLRLGKFTSVNRHEPKNPPDGGGITAAVWVQTMGPTEAFTALNATTALLVFNVRLYQNFLAEPEDEIDPRLLAAADAVIAAVSGDFTLGDTVDFVDLLGQTGDPLRAEAGYVEHSRQNFRIIDITIPIVIADVWAQAR